MISLMILIKIIERSKTNLIQTFKKKKRGHSLSTFSEASIMLYHTCHENQNTKKISDNKPLHRCTLFNEIRKICPKYKKNNLK
jgi:RAB protein geranylgeranyltransferase component A